MMGKTRLAQSKGEFYCKRCSKTKFFLKRGMLECCSCKSMFMKTELRQIPQIKEVKKK